ncbi:MAG: hypothetical protein LC634_04055 [Sphingomonadales bacterium]|nr:hypothetical protein [Sphingomonadales bacterium]
MSYNFTRIHKSLKIIPAMAAGVSDPLWKSADIVMLVEKAEAERPTKLGSYKKRDV